MEHMGFENRYYRESWIQGEGYENGSLAKNDDGSWTVYDGKTNYMGKIWPEKGETKCNGEVTPYKLSFLYAAMEELLKA